MTTMTESCCGIMQIKLGGESIMSDARPMQRRTDMAPSLGKDSILDKSVEKADDGTYDFYCPGIQGSKCGDAVPFTSTGWPTAELAKTRGQQHFDEHKGLAVTPTLEEFRQDQGLTVNDDGSVSVEDI